MTTPRIEEILEEFESRFSKDGLLHDVNGALESREVTDWLRTALTQAHQAWIDEAVEKATKIAFGTDLRGRRYVDIEDLKKALQDNK